MQYLTHDKHNIFYMVSVYQSRCLTSPDDESHRSESVHPNDPIITLYCLRPLSISDLSLPTRSGHPGVWKAEIGPWLCQLADGQKNADVICCVNREVYWLLGCLLYTRCVFGIHTFSWVSVNIYRETWSGMWSNI